MYRVTVVTDQKEYILHDVHSEREQLFDMVLSESMGKTSTFTFSIPPEHPNFSRISMLASEVFVYRVGKETPEFYGRPVSPEIDIYNTGTVFCVGGMSYLADSMQAPFAFTGVVRDFLAKVLKTHNSMVEKQKQLKLGKTDVPGVETTWTNEQYIDTLSLLNTMLPEEDGGYLRVRQEKDGRYLDYVRDYGGFNQQPIRFGENVLDLTRQMDATQVVTLLIPEGDAVSITNPDGTAGEQVVDITSVNGGKNYIQHEAGIAKWGRIWGYAKFSGVTDPEKLLFEAKRYLDARASFPETINLTALDLSLLDVNVQELRAGYWTHFISQPHGLSGTYLLKQLERHLDAPQNDRVVFGAEQRTLSGTTASNRRVVDIKIEKVKQAASREIERKVENATMLITGGLGGYVVIGRAEDGHPEEILIMDAPTKEAAIHVIRLNKNGIGFSREGYHGVYRNAWTIDGNLVADFVTTGTMLADRIRGGTLELGGTGLGKDGKIVVFNSAGKQVAIIDKDGVSANSGVFSGTVQGAKIKAGKNYDVSMDTAWMFYADNERLNIGNNHVVEYNGRYIFETDDSWVGFSPEMPDSQKTGRVSLWANYHPGKEDYDFSVSQSGNTRVKNLSVYGEVLDDIVLGVLDDEYASDGKNWTKVGYNIIRLWHRFSSLEERVSDLENSL